MDDLRPLLERIREQMVPSGGGFERLAARRARRRRNQRVAAGALTLIMFAGTAIGLFIALSRGGEHRPRPAGRLSIRVGGIPIDVAAGEGAVWAATETDDSGGGEIARIDPGTGDVSARVPVEEVGPAAVGEGSVWVANLRGGTVTRIDPREATVVSIIALPPLANEVAKGDRQFVPNDLAVAFGRVWVSTARGSVASIDPSDESVRLETGEAAAILGGLSAGGSSLWAWNDFEPPDAKVWRIDPRTGEVTRFSVPDTVQAAGAGSAGLWLLKARTGDVSLVDPVGGVTRVGGIGEQATVMAVRDPRVFVASADGDAFVIDQGSGNIALLARLSGSPTAMAVETESLWVALASGTVVRLPVSEDAPLEPRVSTPTPAATTSTCEFPRYQPTYLPWLAPGEPILDPTTERIAPGGGPQGLDPGYAILAWGYGDITHAGGPSLKGTVVLWRSTQGAGAVSADPEVPPLPSGGSDGGRLSEAPDSPPGSGDWAIVWADPSPSPYDDPCFETTLAVSLPNLSSEDVRRETLRIAKSLILTPP
jgi:sugar lactone lactonase YvrE